MVDFRIDTLATALSLSPGNITYHFSRKEDICLALWHQYIVESASVCCSLTSLLDLKQLYLISRKDLHLKYRYRGVLIFRSADFGAIGRDTEYNHKNFEEHAATAKMICGYLHHNGYLVSGADNDIFEHIATSNNYISLRWGMNFMYHRSFEADSVVAEVDRLALQALMALYPLLSEKGRDEFAQILGTLYRGKLV